MKKPDGIDSLVNCPKCGFRKYDVFKHECSNCRYRKRIWYD